MESQFPPPLPVTEVPALPPLDTPVPPDGGTPKPRNVGTTAPVADTDIAAVLEAVSRDPAFRDILMSNLVVPTPGAGTPTQTATVESALITDDVEVNGAPVRTPSLREAKPRAAAPTSLFRKLLWKLHLPVWETANDRVEAKLDAIYKAAYPQPIVVGVSAAKGGVGKTTIASLIALNFAAQRPGSKVVILDADLGSLSARAPGEQPRGLTAVSADIEKLPTPAPLNLAAITQHWSGTGVEALGTSTRGQVSLPTAAQITRLVDEYRARNYDLIVVDCPINSALDASIMKLFDVFVLVTALRLDEKDRMPTAREWLTAKGCEHLLSKTIVAMNHTRAKVATDAEELGRQMTAQGLRTLIEFPYDKHLDKGGVIVPEKLSPMTRQQHRLGGAFILRLLQPTHQTESSTHL